MSRPKGGEGASDCVSDVLGEVFKATLPYLERAAGAVQITFVQATLH